MRTLVFTRDELFADMIEDLVRGGCPCHIEFNENPNRDKVIRWIINMDEDMQGDFINDRFLSNNQEIIDYINSNEGFNICKKEKE